MFWTDHVRRMLSWSATCIIIRSLHKQQSLANLKHIQPRPFNSFQVPMKTK